MKKKIKLGETQLNNIIKILVESIDNDSLRYLEDGDVIDFDIVTKNGVKSVILNVQNVDINNDKIKCVSNEGDSVILSTDSYNPSNSTLKLKLLDKKTSSYNNLILNVKDLKFWRDDELFTPPSIKPSSSDYDDNEYLKPLTFSKMPKEFDDLTAGDTLSIKTTNDETYDLNFEKKDEDYHYFKNEDGNDVRVPSYGWDDFDNELTYQTYNSNTNDFISDKINVISFSITKNEDVSNDDELFFKYYKDIINHPNVKKAFFTAPTMWNYFTSALKNKDARGTGIYPAYEIINKYFNKLIDKKLPGFTNKENQWAEFIVPYRIEIPYHILNNNKRLILKIEAGKNRAVVRPYEAGYGDNKILIRRNLGFKILVKKPTNEKENEFLCDIYVQKQNVAENKFKIENVKLTFIKSDGYEPTK